MKDDMFGHAYVDTRDLYNMAGKVSSVVLHMQLGDVGFIKIVPAKLLDGFKKAKKAGLYPAREMDILTNMEEV